MFKISPAKKKAGKYCCAYACRNEPIAKKGGLCHKHYARKIREQDPVYARYNQFKSNATRRGKDFSVTLEEFRRFCIDNNYITVKGNRGQNATIDRVDNSHGYHIWNLQVIPGRSNYSKGTSDVEYPF